MDESVIDRAVYAELQDTTGAEFVAELVDTFIEEGPGMLAELRAARAEGNAERFRRAVHSLKTNGRTFGAGKLPALAREVELKGLDADPTRDVAGLAALVAEYARAADELKALRTGCGHFSCADRRRQQGQSHAAVAQRRAAGARRLARRERPHRAGEVANGTIRSTAARHRNARTGWFRGTRAAQGRSTVA